MFWICRKKLFNSACKASLAVVPDGRSMRTWNGKPWRYRKELKSHSHFLRRCQRVNTFSPPSSYFLPICDAFLRREATITLPVLQWIGSWWGHTCNWAASLTIRWAFRLDMTCVEICSRSRVSWGDKEHCLLPSYIGPQMLLLTVTSWPANFARKAGNRNISPSNHPNRSLL